MTQFKFKLDDLPEHLREQAEAQLAPKAVNHRPPNRTRRSVSQIILDDLKTPLVIDLPFPLPTWNRMLAMNRWERKKLRDAIHAMVYSCVIGESINSKSLDEYDRIIRPKTMHKVRKKKAPL